MIATHRSTPLLLAGCLIVLFATAMARAQTGAGLLLKPWPAEQAFESNTEAYALNSAGSGSGESVQISEYSSAGRLRLEPGNLVSPRIGYDFHFLNTNSKSGIIPRDLTDLSIAVGTAIGQYHGWIAGVTVGMGYAGDAAFSRSSGWYGKGTFELGKQLTDCGAIAVLIDYDGNRPYFPDIPLPGVVYRHNFDDKILLALGLPYSNIQWTPTDRFRFEASYCLAKQFTARAGYEVARHAVIFASYHYVKEAYHIAGLRADERLLFSDQRVECGVEYAPTDHLNFRLAGGYAFDNRFDRGFGFENTHGYLPFNDAPYIGLSLELKI